MGTIKRKKRHARPGPKVDLVETAMFCTPFNSSPAEIEEIRRAAALIGADRWFADWLAQPNDRTPEPILSDEAGAAILADPLGHAEHVPGGFRAWVHRQVDGPQLWRGWLEEIRQSQIERRNVNA